MYSKRTKKRDIILSALLLAEVVIVLSGGLFYAVGELSHPVITTLIGIAMAVALLICLVFLVSGTIEFGWQENQREFHDGK